MPLTLNAALDRFALITGHKSVGEILSANSPHPAKILPFTASPSFPWYLNPDRDL